MEIGQGDYRYNWIDNWATVPASNRDNGRTHGVQVTRDGDVVIFNQGNPAVLIFAPDGTPRAQFGDYPGAHGLTLREEDGREVLWVTDQSLCCVRKLTLDGQELLELPAPPEEALVDPSDGKARSYIPTWADTGPDGDIWVGDGYGSHYVFRFAPDGTYKGRTDGTDGAGRFREPHGLAFSPGNELWLTDRANHRVCVYDADGKLLRHKEWLCHSPCTFAFDTDGNIYVPELFTGVKILTPDLELVAALGEHPEIKPNEDRKAWWPPRAPQGWPNLSGEDLKPGLFNSPHGIAVNGGGDIFVVEWIVGGRITKLERIRA